MIYASPIIGYLAKDAEEYQTPNGKTMLRMRVGSTRTRADRDGHKTTDWVSVLYGNTALKPYLTKGKMVIISGELEVGTWTNKEGQTQTDISVFANSLQLGGSRDAAQPNTAAPNYGQQGAQQAPQQPQRPPMQNTPTSTYNVPPEGPNDELPF